MKTLIITEYGQKIGLGHIMRCISIYDALDKYKLNPILIVNSKKDNLKDFTKERNVKIMDWIDNFSDIHFHDLGGEGDHH